MPIGVTFGDNKRKGSSWSPPSPGWKLVVVKNAEPTTTQKGDAMLLFTYEIVGPEREAGQTFRDYCAYGAENGAYWLQRRMIAMGYEEDDLTGEMVIDEEDLIDLSLGVLVAPDTYQGKPSAKITDWVRQDDVRVLQAVNEEQADPFAEGGDSAPEQSAAPPGPANQSPAKPPRPLFPGRTRGSGQQSS